MKKTRILYGLLSLFTLLTGIGIYLFFRDLHNIMLFTWIQKPQFIETVLVPLQPTVFSGFLKYHFPNMLWFISGMVLLRFIWFYNSKAQTVYIVCFYLIGFSLEISQLSDKIPGTFDWLDLLFIGIAAFGEGLLYKTLVLRRMA